MVLHAPSVHSRLAHHQHYHCAFPCHRPLSAPVALALNPPAPVADRRDVLQEAPALLLHHGPTAAPPRRRGLHHHHHGTGAAFRQGLHHRLQYCRHWPDGAQPGRVCAAAQAGAGTQAGGRSGSIASCKAGCGGATVGLLRTTGSCAWLPYRQFSGTHAGPLHNTRQEPGNARSLALLHGMQVGRDGCCPCLEPGRYIRGCKHSARAQSSLARPFPHRSGAGRQPWQPPNKQRQQQRRQRWRGSSGTWSSS